MAEPQTLPERQAARATVDPWPPLPYEEWRPTLDNLHLCSQVVGKIRLALAPMEPQWNQVPLQITSRGLWSPPLTARGVGFDIEMDLLAHQVLVRDRAGAVIAVPLNDRPIAAFYADVMAALAKLGADVRVSTLPSELPHPVRFQDDHRPRAYDPAAASRFLTILTSVQSALGPFHAAYRGRSTPVQFFWGSFDLNLSRYSGRPAEPPPDVGVIMRYTCDAEHFCVGWWPGSPQMPRPGFYAYAYPQPAGLELAALSDAPGGWDSTLGEFFLPYDEVRSLESPEAAIDAFAEMTYIAAAELSGWDEPA